MPPVPVFTKMYSTRIVRKRKFQSILMPGISLLKPAGQWQRVLTNQKLCEFGPCYFQLTNGMQVSVGWRVPDRKV